MSTTRSQIDLESLGSVTLVVDDVDEALAFYTDRLGFEKRQDETFEMNGSEGRWVTIGLPGDDVEISLSTPDEPYYDEDTRATLEAKHGVETWWTFRTTDCEATAEDLDAAGVEVTQPPTEYPWGTEAMFADPFGNEFSLFESAR